MKKIFLGLLAMMVSATLFAAPRTAEEAAQIAAQFTNQQPQLRKLHKSPRAAANMRLAHKALQNNSEQAAYYVFNQEDNNGFVIVSADDRTAEDVLGYTENGAFDMNTANPNLKWWLSRYTKEITALQSMDDSELEPRKAVQVTAIAPLLVNQNGEEITWYQEAPYNNLCPMDLLDTTRSYTGCVATATAQIMYKWRWPQQGTGSSSYTWEHCITYDNNTDECTNTQRKTLSANYGNTTYDWNNMLPAYGSVNYSTAQADAVATLMYHCGVAAEMAYGGDEAGGSGAWTDDMAYGLKTYFDYTFDKFISMYSETKYGGAHEGVTAEFSVTRDQFTTYFNADLEAGRPIIMGGEDSDGGHEFVCDGRDASNRFHINWGWEGDCNGYYALSSLRPSGTNSNFSTNLDALIGLRPDRSDLPPVTVTWSVDGATSTTSVVPGNTATPATTPADCNCGKKFMGWTAQSSIQGGAKPDDLFTTGKVVNEATTFYAVYAEEQAGQGEAAFDGTTGGTFKIYAQAGNTKYYAKGTVNNNKLESTTNESDAAEFVLTPVSGGFTIKTGGKYLANGSKTNVSLGSSSYTWTVENGTQGTWRVNSSTNTGRALSFRAGEYNVFGAYATSNINGTEYFDLEIGGQGGATYSNYALTCSCSGSDIVNAKTSAKAVKVMENGQIVIIRDNEKYTIFGQKIQ